MSGELTAITGVLAAIIAVVFAGLIWLIKKQFDQNNTTIKDSTIANKQNTDAYIKLSDVIERLDRSITDRDKQDNEFQKNVMVSFKKMFKLQDRNYAAVINQQVGVQNVEKQIVKK